MSNAAQALIGELEHEQIDGLIAAAGVGGAREIIEAFCRSTRELIDALRAQISDNALDLGARTGHAIKGSAANVGALGLARAAATLEEACRRGDAGGAGAALAQVSTEFDAAQRAFEDHFNRA